MLIKLPSPSASQEAPPRHRNGVDLVYDNGDITIAQRGAEFAVVHTPNARWFVTNQRGADIVRRFADHLSATDEDFPCSRAELQFLREVLATGFLERPADAPADIPTVVCLSLTERCNLSCHYCFYSASPDKNKSALHVRNMPVDNLKRLFEELHELNPRARVYLTGGEPFINTQIIDYFRLIKESNLYAGVVTNGTLLTDAKIQEMRRVGVDEVRISIDGMTSATHNRIRPNTFTTVLRALALLKKHELCVVLSMTVTNENQGEVGQLAAFAKRHGFLISYSHMVPTGRGAESSDRLPDYQRLVADLSTAEEINGFEFLDHENAQGVRRHTCGLAGQSLYVDLHGSTSPCNMLSKSGHELGNVFSSSLTAVLSGLRATAMRASVDEVRYCRSCHVRYICGGPCRASSYFAVGNLNTRGPDCAFKYSEVIESIFSKGRRILGQ